MTSPRDLLIPSSVLLAGGILILLVPLIPHGQTYAMRLVTQCELLATLAISWNLVGGLTGYPSFATAAFFGLGAYVSGVLQQIGLPWAVGLVAAGLAAAVLAAPFGFAILRLRGHYFAIASLMLIAILREITTGWASLTGGGMGLNVPGAASDPETTARFALQSMLGLSAVALASSALVAKSWVGFGLSCIRMNETAAAGAGIDAALLKTLAFTLSSSLAGAAGAIYASWIGYIDPSDVYDVMWSVRPIVAVLIGGLATIFGPVIGTVVYVALEEVLWRNILTFGTGALGFLIIALLFLLPSGILPSLRRRLMPA